MLALRGDRPTLVAALDCVRVVTHSESHNDHVIDGKLRRG